MRGAFDWFRHHAPAMLEPVPVETEALRAGVEFVPLGVLFAIMPWNFPYWQVIRALAVLSREVVNAGDGWPVAEAAVWPPAVVVADE